MGTKIVASFCLVFLSFCLFFGHNEATEVINLNWARVLGSNTEVQNCTESCDGVCGNGKCEPNESPCSCPCDCGFCCKDGFCRHDKGETFENCPSDCALTLKVQVVDADTNQALATSPFSPFPRTSVQCVTRSKTFGPEYVDENGAYSWTGVPADYYTCTATLQGFNTNSQQVLLQTLISDKNRPAVIPLSIQLGTVSGIVEFAVNSGPITAPLTGAEVVCNSTSGRLFFRQSESPFGKYFVANIPPGVYQCTASKKYYVSATQTISVSLQQNTASNFLLMPLPGNMIGQVIDTVSGLGVRRMQVICSSVSGVTLTNRDGFFTLTGVPSGPITCSASGEGYIAGSSSFTVGQGANVTTTIYVTSMTSNITGVVVNAKDANEFIWDAKINCIYNSSDYEGPVIQKIVYSDRYGNFFMDNFFAGNYTCNATRTSFAPLAIDIVVPIATKIQLDFKLEPYPTQISGRVLDKWSGLPVNEVTIICYDNDRKFETGRKASQLDGTYTMPELIGGGSNTCSYQKWNYFTETVCEKLIRGVSYDWVVYLTPKTGNIAGVIRDIREPHFGIANATAVCSLEFNRNVTHGNPLGEYRFDNIRIGTQYCEYSAERFFPNSTSIVVNYNETSNGDIYLTPRPATVNIEVYDISLGLLIPANVSCVDNEQKETNFTTDFLGLYQFVGVNSFGNWRCTASRPGFKPGTNTTVVDYGLTSRMILYITPDVGVIGGKVTDAVFGTPLTNAVVQCSRVVDVNYAVFSNSLGDYLIINLERDIYYCTATAVGYVSASATVRVVEGGSSRQDYQLMPLPATLVIVVLDNNELKQIPLANATVLCSNLTTDANRTTARYLNMTGENGTVVFADLLTGNFSCDISYPNYVSQTKLTFLVGGETQKITVLLDPITVLITGTVFSSDSTPSNPITVAGAQIDVFEIRTGRMITRAFSSATNGQYSFAVRIPEFYAINVSATLFNSFYAPLGLISAARNIPITLVPAGILVVVNVTESGSNDVIVNAGVGLKRVIAGKPDQAISFLATDSQGRATFNGLATGTYRLSVSATGYEEPPTQLIDALFSGRIYSAAFQMSLKAGEVRGTIVLVGAASDNLEGFTVRILGTSLSTFTDNTGAYAFTSVAAGTYTIEVSNTGYNTASSNFTLTQGTSARLLPITVSKVTGGISGNIYKAGTLNTPTGVAVQVRVRLAGSDLNQYLGSATVPNGQTSFSIPGLPPGFLYDVVATAGQGSGWQDNVVQAQVVSGQMADVVIFLSQN